jgi:two-component system, OmpR family, sensor kinase
MTLRARLVASVCAVALVALAIAGAATYTAFSRAELRQLDDGLQRAHQPIEDLVATGDGDPVREIEQAAPGTFVALQDPDGQVQFTIPARAPGHEPATVDLAQFAALTWSSDRTARGPDPAVFRTADNASGEGDLRLRISALDDGSILFIGQTLHEVAEARRQLLAIELVVTAAALAIAAAAGWWLVQVGLRPLRRVEQTALAIADRGEFDHRAPGADVDNEVGRVAAALNTMLDRIHTSFEERDRTEAALRESGERMRRFVADVSHELRTPLAAVSAYTELFERGARSHPEDLERALHGIATETSRMNDLVEELLLLARLDEGRPLEHVTVDLSEVLVDAIGTARTVAPDYPTSLSMARVVTISGDPARLRQVIDNLIANVRTHTLPGTATQIDLSTDGDAAVITVSDNGQGMPQEQADRVFERFYRADLSRSRASGGSGLGLSIVHALVQAHGGTVDVESAPDQGFCVTVRLPLLSVPGENDEVPS